MKKSVFLWSPTNGKQSFSKEHAANLLKLQTGRPSHKVTWFEYDNQDAKGSGDNLSNQEHAIDNPGGKGDPKKGKRKASE